MSKYPGSDMAWVHSHEYEEDIFYYTDDLQYSFTVLGCGEKSEKPYNLTFDEDGKLVDVERIEEE